MESGGGLFGRVSESTVFRFALFIVLVWIAVDLGILMAGLFPRIPAGTRAVMAPEAAGGAAPAPAMTLG